eukprot:PLAT15955.1.p1 GENE.PLAT15955.1~~PLAT15955.1.p1  ORF type:complete len:665 (+),score=380.37 PLAT15955.1:24-1997(+)
MADAKAESEVDAPAPAEGEADPAEAAGSKAAASEAGGESEGSKSGDAEGGEAEGKGEEASGDEAPESEVKPGSATAKKQRAAVSKLQAVNTCGWMTKKGEKFFSSWKERFFVLTRFTQLLYFKDTADARSFFRNEGTYHGRLDLQTVVSLQRSKIGDVQKKAPAKLEGREDVLQLRTLWRTWVLAPRGDEQLHMWTRVLTQFVSTHNATLYAETRDPELQKPIDSVDPAALSDDTKGWLERLLEDSGRVTRVADLSLEALRNRFLRALNSQNAAAAAVIQRAFRAHQLRKATAPAVVLQRVFRGFSARKSYRLEVKGICRIQRAWRAYRVRKGEASAREEAAVKLQATFRGVHARRQHAQRLKEREDAARMLQARTRGFLARKELRSREQAAVRIQASFKGSRLRRSMSAKAEIAAAARAKEEADAAAAAAADAAAPADAPAPAPKDKSMKRAASVRLPAPVTAEDSDDSDEDDDDDIVEDSAVVVEEEEEDEDEDDDEVADDAASKLAAEEKAEEKTGAEAEEEPSLPGRVGRHRVSEAERHGWLSKRGKFLKSRWRRRYFVTHEDALWYFKSKDAHDSYFGSAKGVAADKPSCISLKTCVKVAAIKEAGLAYSGVRGIQLTFEDGSLRVLCPFSNYEVTGWMAAIRAAAGLEDES